MRVRSERRDGGGRRVYLGLEIGNLENLNVEEGGVGSYELAGFLLHVLGVADVGTGVSEVTGGGKRKRG